ncbi:uncharacterized protein LOC126396000 [Epinephelus moara]|uniref:uncharacterized protein LOC126396000 n=1 Tax=Epinephelus moara TaxID=300413 RepID=UPI00214E14C5|nr:uncharacterized protein LOC126396000 [Epinephelus moara]
MAPGDEDSTAIKEAKEAIARDLEKRLFRDLATEILEHEPQSQADTRPSTEGQDPSSPPLKKKTAMAQLFGEVFKTQEQVRPLPQIVEDEVASYSFKSMDLAMDAVIVDEEQANNLLNSVIELDVNGSNPMDSDYVPPICVRAAGGLQSAIDALPIVGLDESVDDILNRNDETDEDPDNPESDEEKDNDVPSFPGPEKVSVEDDLVDQPACIAFNSSLACMVNFLQLLIKKCYYREDQMGTECDATPPFQVKFLKRGSATIIEWVS